MQNISSQAGPFARMRTLLAMACLFALTPAGAAPATANSHINPGNQWRAFEAGHDADTCRSDLAAAQSKLQRLDTTALFAAKNGMALFQYGPVDETSIVFSVRKSILAMLYGKYVLDGHIDLNARLTDLDIDDRGGLLPVERQARVQDLLESRSGVFHPAANGGDDLAHAPPRGSHPPGTYFLYNNWDFNVAGTVFERQTGKGIYEAFLTELAGPLQLEDFDPRKHHKSGDLSKSAHLAYPFYLSTRDMARIGLLMLNGGEWNGTQVIAPEWIKAITTLRTPSSEMHPQATAMRQVGYGRMWWVLETPPASPLAGAYMAWGVHGQFILVIPSKNMVIAHKRKVPVGDNWNVSWVRLADFLQVAEALVAARC